MRRKILASFDASATLFGIGLETAYKQLSNIRYSSVSMTTILRCTITCAPTRYTIDPEFIERAKRTLANDVDSFRRKYGSYFVGGYVECSSLSAITKYTATTADELQSFQASFKAGKGFAKVDAGLKIQSAALNKNIQQSVTWQPCGLDLTDLEPDFDQSSFKKIFDNYTRNRPKPLIAIMYNYFLIAPKYEKLLETRTVSNALKEAAMSALDAQRQCLSYSFTESKRLQSELRDIGQALFKLQPTDAFWKVQVAKYEDLLAEKRMELDLWSERHDLLRTARGNAKDN